ncbi:MAG: YicC/YloC family endoribonuclease [Candidatus Lernaella stagnicola]|nr:YicC/YloC family endoribonuclease [Candidatus Lernaella stagnicola]
MINSMTGFGRGESAAQTCRVQVDIRCVNHRYLDIQLRLPRALYPLEVELRDWIKKAFRRGRMEVAVIYERLSHDAGKIRVDPALATGYKQAMDELASRLDYENAAPFELIVRQPGVLEFGEEHEDAETVRPVLQSAFNEAAAAARGMREREGERLAGDLQETLGRLAALREELVVVIPPTQQELADRYREKAKQAAGEYGLEETRLHQEVAMWLGKLDVNEEVVRLNSHIEQAREMIDSAESVGRRLDFLAQEMHREVTTLGNKVQGLAVGRLVLEGKAEVEKFREQVQNVE